MELGGTDQLFNLIMGRHLQARAGQEQQIVLTTPLLVGLDGEQKMSKSLGNYVGIAEIPSEQFGKVMSIADGMIPAYFQYATDWPPEQVADTTRQLADGTLHPNAAKRMLARAVVDLYHGAGAGEAAEGDFDRMFKAHEQPQEVPEMTVEGDVPRKLSQWLVLLGLAASNRRRAANSRPARSRSRACPSPRMSSTPPPTSRDGRSRTGSGSGPDSARTRVTPARAEFQASDQGVCTIVTGVCNCRGNR